MGILEFIDAMTGRLAWPIAAITLGLLFRRALTKLIDRITRIRWGEAAAELGDLAEAAEGVQEAIKVHAILYGI